MKLFNGTGWFLNQLTTDHGSSRIWVFNGGCRLGQSCGVCSERKMQEDVCPSPTFIPCSNILGKGFRLICYVVIVIIHLMTRPAIGTRDLVRSRSVLLGLSNGTNQVAIQHRNLISKPTVAPRCLSNGWNYDSRWNFDHKYFLASIMCGSRRSKSATRQLCELKVVWLLLTQQLELLAIFWRLLVPFVTSHLIVAEHGKCFCEGLRSNLQSLLASVLERSNENRTTNGSEKTELFTMLPSFTILCYIYQINTFRNPKRWKNLSAPLLCH